MPNTSTRHLRGLTRGLSWGFQSVIFVSAVLNCGITLLAALPAEGKVYWLRNAPRVIDIADLDLQEMEAEVIESALPEINGRVMRMHIGTHSPKVEEGLRRCLHEAGWILVRDYACHSSRETPFGRIAFGDGVQRWINPRFEQSWNR
jgi:hypothetical protein